MRPSLLLSMSLLPLPRLLLMMVRLLPMLGLLTMVVMTTLNMMMSIIITTTVMISRSPLFKDDLRMNVKPPALSGRFRSIDEFASEEDWVDESGSKETASELLGLEGVDDDESGLHEGLLDGAPLEGLAPDVDVRLEGRLHTKQVARAIVGRPASGLEAALGLDEARTWAVHGQTFSIGVQVLGEEGEEVEQQVTQRQVRQRVPTFLVLKESQHHATQQVTADASGEGVLQSPLLQEHLEE